MSILTPIEILSSILRILDAYLMGYDVFISYTWKDGREYAEALAAELQKKRYRCFIDSSEYRVGDDLNRDARRAVKWSRALAIVVTQNALASKHVRNEINLFEQSRKPIVPIDVDNALYQRTVFEDGIVAHKLSDAHNSLREKSSTKELIEIDKTFSLIGRDSKLQIEEPRTNKPSPSTITMLYERFNFTRKISRRFRIIGTTCVLLIALATLAWISRNEAEHQRNQAEENLVKAISVAKTITEEVDHKLEDVPGAEEVREKLLGTAYSMLAGLLEQAPSNTQVEVVQADTAQNLGTWHFRHGLLDIAKMRFEQANAVYTKSLGNEAKVIRSLLNLGRTNRELRLHSLAKSNYEKAISLSLSLESGNEASKYMAEAFYGLGDIFHDTADLNNALQKHLEAENLRRSIVESEPESRKKSAHLEVLLNLGASTDRVAHIYDQIGDLKSAMLYHEESYRIAKQLLLSRPGSGQYRRDFALAASRLGYDYQRSNNLDKALLYYQEGESLLGGLVEVAPGSKQFRYDWAIALTDLGDIFTSLKDFTAATKHYNDSLIELEKVLALDPENSTIIGQKIVTQNAFAEMCKASQNTKEALKWYSSALDLTEKKIRRWPNIPNQHYTKVILLKSIGKLLRVDDPHESINHFNLAYKEVMQLVKKYPGDPRFRKTLEEVLQLKKI